MLCVKKILRQAEDFYFQRFINFNSSITIW